MAVVIKGTVVPGRGWVEHDLTQQLRVLHGAVRDF